MNQLVRFCVVGVIGFIIDASILQFLVVGTHANPYLARLFSFFIAAICTWGMNRRFTFDVSYKATHQEWLSYVAFMMIGFLVNYSAFAFSIKFLPLADARPWIGVAIGSIAGLGVNFLTSRLLFTRSVVKSERLIGLNINLKKHNMNSERITLTLYFFALLFIGLGYLAILPVFEGFDETAHYSSVRQIADTKTIPIYGASYLDQEVTDYKGPSPYGSLSPPFDQGMTYAKFFAQTNSTDNYILNYRQSSALSTYRPSQSQNWQAQHPPLYYILMAPIEKIISPFPFITRIFILRLVSFIFALGGVFLGLLACRNQNITLKDDPSILGFIIYPIILPMFFAEFTRIGNDSLCLFLVGIIALLLSKLFKDINNKKLPLAIGIALGLGLLTKAFFIPITVALCFFFLLHIFFGKDQSTVKLKHRNNLILVILPTVIIGAGWYFYKLMVFGTFIGSADSIQLASQGGLLVNLSQNFSLYGLVRGVLATIVSYSYAGTWSLTRLPALFHIPLLMLASWCFGVFALQLKKRPFTDSTWLAVLLLCTFGAGFLHHIIISLAINGNGNTPGWYFHILMPWIAPVLGIGYSSIYSRTRLRPFLIGLLIYAVLFQLMALWSQLALFMGCATKSDEKLYAFSGHALCLDQAPLLFDRLSVLGWPILAAVGFGGGFICSVLLLFVWKKKLHSL